MSEKNSFAATLLAWFDRHGRHDLPWQQDACPYHVWVSEIMLQQTQVKTVIPYYLRFIERFGSVQALAAANIDEVLHYWTGLGYYARARNLHKAAGVIVSEYGGEFPESLEEMMGLPGIGRSTAGAILSLAFGQRHPILDGNVKRVLTRVYCIDGWPGQSQVEKQLWALAEDLTPHDRTAAYTQAIMDLGATVCTRTQPGCDHCPVTFMCKAHTRGEQSRYPNPKPKTGKPVRATIFMVIENPRGEVFLEQRPPSGIWGGLWGFPECDNKKEIQRRLQQLGLEASSITSLEPLRHTFSHFHLDINPVHCQVTGSASVIREVRDQCWFKNDGTARLGMAAPIIKLLERLELFNDTNGKLRKAG
ncbi:MAG: A/G-specific adenine glycosylase [Gammaproteobacteria bacterium]|nr:A/G-specific adenine glycosylase [Gammaproteobacteria bacterium]